MYTPHETKSIAAPTLLEIPVDLITSDPKNRKEHDLAKLKSLAASIEAEGLLQPIVVRETVRDPQVAGAPFQIVAGERRWRVFMLLKRAKIPAIVLVDKDNALVGAARKRLVENLQREDLTPIEEARQFRELTVDHKMTQADVAKLAGCSQPAIANALRLLELPAGVQEIIQAGSLTRAHGVTLCRWAKWPKACVLIAERTAKSGLTTKELEKEDLPFADKLCAAKLAVRIDCSGYSYDGKATYKITDAMKSDPAYFGGGYHTYCLEPEKWAPEKALQDAEFAKKRAVAKKVETGRQSKMSPNEKAARVKKIAENKQNRADVEERLAAAEIRLAKVSDFDASAIRVLAHEAMNAYRGPTEDQLDTAASALGIEIPKKLSFDEPDLLEVMKPVDLVRLVAAAIARAKSDEALKYAGEVPDVLAHLAGKPNGAKSSAGGSTVKVTVNCNGSDNRARAGLAQASATSSPADAARRAAAKHFGCDEDLVVLVCARPGNSSGVYAIYTATKRSAASAALKQRITGKTNKARAS